MCVYGILGAVRVERHADLSSERFTAYLTKKFQRSWLFITGSVLYSFVTYGVLLDGEYT